MYYHTDGSKDEQWKAICFILGGEGAYPHHQDWIPSCQSGIFKDTVDGNDYVQSKLGSLYYIKLS